MLKSEQIRSPQGFRKLESAFFYKICPRQGHKQKLKNVFFYKLCPRQGHKQKLENVFCFKQIPPQDTTKTEKHVVVQTKGQPPQDTTKTVLEITLSGGQWITLTTVQWSA